MLQVHFYKYKCDALLNVLVCAHSVVFGFVVFVSYLQAGWFGPQVNRKSVGSVEVEQSWCVGAGLRRSVRQKLVQT